MPKRVLVVDANERHRKAIAAGIKNNRPTESFEVVETACHKSALITLIADQAIEEVCLHGVLFERKSAIDNLTRPSVFVR